MTAAEMQMITTADIDAAVNAGALDRAAADRLLAFIATSRDAGQADEENLRFITSFNDIFVSIGLGLFLGALSYMARGLGAALDASVVAIAAWGLAEIFTRRKRMALPSIILLAVFAVACLFACFFAFTGGSMWTIFTFTSSGARWPLLVAGLFAATMSALHWFRFHVPITIAAGVAGIALAVIAISQMLFPDLLLTHSSIVLVPLGLVAFGIAMRFDMSDTARRTKRTDIAFWLHLLAAPFIVHPVVQEIGSFESLTVAQALAIVAMFVVLSVVALIVDRRALLASSLAYLGYAAFVLISQAGWQASTAAAAIMAVGIVVLGLSVLWRPLRSALVKPLPDTLRARIPAPA
jgi:hypothetical protein